MASINPTRHLFSRQSALFPEQQPAPKSPEEQTPLNLVIAWLWVSYHFPTKPLVNVRQRGKRSPGKTGDIRQ
ncbi:uncharacterized protein ATNIH1004_001977 [Aspergillus tanneri]|uniref:Uncharacterized protein n=1 Tax=Aspergillus tanneri TaxID=1220188 RepID=A0A5M9M315_9EURO|nr:uncharacterized protein ATNIH1004_001977 [Aspergillus tanneri]KAA8641375.1 hypothetical protein ATNIH1004_001977 [Aspergillus tanneri]